MKFHAFAEEYQLMPAYEMGRMEEAMRLRGFDPRFPIIIYDGKILDGRNRFKAAKAVGIEPIFDTFFGSDEQAKTFVAMANEERRHLAPEWLKRRREERIERATTARANGQTIREIAKDEGVSAKTIHQDLKSVTPVTKEDESTETPQNGGETQNGHDESARGARSQDEPEDWKRVREYLGEHPGASNKEVHRALYVSEHVVAKVKLKMAIDRPLPTINQDADDATDAPVPTSPKRKKAKKKNGSEVFDWKTNESHFGKLVQSLEKVNKGYEPESKSREYLECRRLLSSFWTVWESWKKRLLKV